MIIRIPTQPVFSCSFSRQRTMNCMRFLTVALAALLLMGCFSGRPVRHSIHQAPRKAAAPPRKVQPPLPSAPIQPPRVTSQTVSGIRFVGVSFDSRSHRLVVADQANGPGSEFADSAAAAKSVDGLAAINAGFFTPEGQPLGQVITHGKPLGAWNNASSLGSGLWFETTAGNSAIARRRELGPAVAIKELIQAGPLLIENRQAVGGLESIKISARSVILWDGGSRWWIGHSSPCSLAALAQSLTAGQPAGWSVRHALNLDGGRSSDFWVSGSIAGGPVLIRPPWNKPVRNFLVLIDR